MAGASIQTQVKGRVEALERLLAEQVELLGQVDALSQRQRGLVEARDTGRLLGLLAERGRLLERLAASSAALSPYRASWAETVAGVEPERARAWEERLERIARASRAIADRDGEDGALIEGARRELLERLGGFGLGRAAMSAYGARPAPRARMMDGEG